MYTNAERAGVSIEGGGGGRRGWESARGAAILRHLAEVALEVPTLYNLAGRVSS